jgi:hypothetical protein
MGEESMMWLHPQPSQAFRRAFALSLGLLSLAAGGANALPPPDSHQQNPTVTFTSKGNYTVTLMACNAGGCTPTTKTVTVLDPVPHITSLTNPPSLTGVGLPITLQDTATGRPTLTHKWTLSSSVLPVDLILTGNPVTWTPLLPGSYQAHLTVSNGDGMDASTPVPVTVALFSFADVPPSYWAWHFIEGLQTAGIPTSCGTNPLRYCPDNPMTRGDMATFLLRAKEGGSYVPPACTTAVFTDVPCSDPLAPWINELVRRGVTAGCGGGNYCPNSAVTRDQMAVFLVVTAGIPPDTGTCTTPPFTDVPCSTPFEPYIKKLVSLGVTAGCGGGNYCPQTTLTRAQMAIFLSVMFHIPTV